MKKRTLGLIATIAVVALAAACGGGDDGLARSEVQEIVREEMAAQSQGAGTPGMVPADVEGIVNDAIKEMPQPSLALPAPRSRR